MYEEFQDTKGVIRICISKKNRQRNGQKEKDKRGRRGCDCMVVGFTTTYAISGYHH
jgi:hypothetical protein